MINITEVGKIAGAATRIGRIDPEIDRNFFHRSKGSIARFAFNNREDPALSARKLVAAELVDPNNPCAIALQEADEMSGKPAWIEPQDFVKGGDRTAAAILSSDASRSVRVSAAALARRMHQPGFSHMAAAEGFEKLALQAHSEGSVDGTRHAVQGFVQATRSGLEASALTREPQQPRRSAAREL